METRLALIGIIVEDLNSTEKINETLHEYAQYIVGRMGLPYKTKGVAIITQHKRLKILASFFILFLFSLIDFVYFKGIF